MATAKKQNTAQVADTNEANVTPDTNTDTNKATDEELAKLKSEIAALNEALAAKNAEATTSTVSDQPVQSEPMVTVQLFKDSGKYKDDVFVAVNGRSYQIKRGEPVSVPKCVYDIIQQSMGQDYATADLIARESESFSAQAMARGLL